MAGELTPHEDVFVKKASKYGATVRPISAASPTLSYRYSMGQFACVRPQTSGGRAEFPSSLMSSRTVLLVSKSLRLGCGSPEIQLWLFFFFFAEVGPFVFHSKTFICRTVTISFSTVPSSLSPNVKAEGTQRLPRSLPSSSASVMEEWVHCFDFDSADGPNRIKWR